MALRNASGHYYINGNWRIDFAGEYAAAGTTFHYERKHKGKRTDKRSRCDNAGGGLRTLAKLVVASKSKRKRLFRGKAKAIK